MLTKEQVASEYTLDERGIVRSPGKFEGEPWYAVSLWDCALDGGSDEQIEDCQGTSVEIFNVDAELASLTGVPVGQGKTVIGLWERDDGFVISEVRDLHVRNLDGYHDCPCRDCFEIAIGCDAFGNPDLCHACDEHGCDASGNSPCSDEMRGCDGDDDTSTSEVK